MPDYTVTYRPAGTHEVREVVIKAPNPRSAFKVAFGRQGTRRGQPPPLSLLGDGDVMLSSTAADGRTWPYRLSAPDLKRRNWTEAEITKELGDPDDYRPNPMYRTAPMTRLYDAARVLAAEDTAEIASLAAAGVMK